jgi:BirA family transcriptional regulator, biotin operon repressor / biotin---[acetyl-CoA-carboxylase] ligase
MTVLPELDALMNARWEHFTSIDSTSSFLMSMDPHNLPEGYTCSADQQLKGRGRHQRHWISFPGGLYLSILLKPRRVPQQWGLLSLLFSVGIAESIEEHYSDLSIKVKWPNDLLLNDKKIGGILLEGSLSLNPWLIAGVGLNITNDVSALRSRSIFPGTSLSEVSKYTIPVSVLASGLRYHLLESYLKWEYSTDGITEEWLSRSATKDQLIRLSMNDQVISGIDRGVDMNGNLNLETGGQVITVRSADLIYYQGVSR